MSERTDIRSDASLPLEPTRILKGGGRDRRRPHHRLSLVRPLEPRTGRHAAKDFAPNAFLRIAPDNSVTVIAKHLEMGQGTYTGLATIVAEELDADWAQIRVESAPADASKYANLAFGTMQGTGGSSAMANSWMQLRKAGATARAMLVAAAATRMECAAGEPDGRARRCSSCAEQSPGDVRRAGRQGVEPAGAERGAAQGPQRLQAHRPEIAACRYSGKDQRHGAIHHRRDFPGHAGRRAAASAAVRRDGQIVRRHRGQGGARRGRGACKCRAASPLWPRASGRRSKAAMRSRSSGTTARRKSAAPPRSWREYRTLAEQPGKPARKDGDAAAALAGRRQDRHARPTSFPISRMRRWSRWMRSCNSTPTVARSGPATSSRPSIKPTRRRPRGSSRSR